ncbi:MAG: hypothetical protein LBG17_00135 [Bacteroidales bacterium]|jgi:hypothetical protein|nr:hypothetical protein [Bacteroidales bacterium]
MKNKYFLTFVCVVLSSYLSMYGQLPTVVSAPIMEWLEESQTAQMVANFAEQIKKYEEMIGWARDQIDKVKEVKGELQKTYDFAERNYQKLKRVAEGIKDFNLKGFVYFAEQELGRSLNPADYMLHIDNEEYNKFRKAISYDPGNNVSTRAQYAYNYLAGLDNAVLDLQLWTKAREKKKLVDDIRASDASRVVDSMALVTIRRLLYDTTLVIGDGERLQLLLQAQKILADNAANRTVELGSIEEELNRKIIELEVIRRNHNTANSIYAYNNVITARWSNNKGFSLAKYAKQRNKKVKPVTIDTGVQFKR